MFYALFQSNDLGDLVPEKDKVWEFLTNFVKFIDILKMLSETFAKSKLVLLSKIFKDPLLQYHKFFKDTLKPKYHLLLHYCAVILNSGPTKLYWCFPH